ncbi:PAS domain S-box protein [Patescibacteria group bacterium]|nr:PAS domain S-box protein [Patescibacteria group bacterium]MBU1721167.1 PAS domain S-box protein [Patescibacteria group bacterium]MBU1900903.1 PAS domain S-box protein [Patescibacteria group bacterium]
MKRKKTLQWYVVENTLIMAVILGLVSFLMIFFFLKAELIQEKENTLFHSVEDRSLMVDSFFRKTQEVPQHIATSQIISDFLKGTISQEEVHTYLEGYLFSEDYLVVYIMDSYGKTIASTDESFLNKNYGFRDYFLVPQKTGTGYLDMALGVTSKELGLYFSQPILDIQGNFKGVVVLKTKENLVQHDFAYEKKHSVVVSYIDDRGVVFSSDQQKNIFKSIFPLEDIEKEFVEQKRYVGQTIFPLEDVFISQEVFGEYSSLVGEIDYNYGNVIFAYAQVGDWPVYLLVQEDGSFLESVYLLTVYVGLGIVGTILVSGVILSYLLMHLFKPITILEQKMENVIAGNYKEKINEEVGKIFELSRLVHSFNVLVQGIVQSKKNIDKVVVDQTNRLAEQTQDLEDQKVAILNILEDVEEERDKSVLLANDLKKFQLAVEEASDHIVITDADGIVLYANNAVERITGFSREEVLGQKAGSPANWGGNMDQKTYIELWKTAKDNKKSFEGAFKNRRKSGEEYIAKASITPVLNNRGEVIFFVGIERDITQEKLVDQAKTEFVSLASHQLRTPLSAINWYAEMLLNGDAGHLTVEQSQYVQEIYRGNQRMVELVNSLLNVSRLELGTFLIEPTSLQLIDIAKEALEEIEIQAAQKKIKIETTFPKKLAKMNLDKKLTYMIFQNLLSNAVKYNQEGGKVSLTIKADKKYVQIIIADNGLGIPKSQHDKIFSKLFRADNVRETDTEGTGLGLYIIKSILDQVNGKISFVSAKDKGTTFHVFIPIKGMKRKEGTKSLS